MKQLLIGLMVLSTSSILASDYKCVEIEAIDSGFAILDTVCAELSIDEDTEGTTLINPVLKDSSDEKNTEYSIALGFFADNHASLVCEDFGFEDNRSFTKKKIGSSGDYVSTITGGWIARGFKTFGNTFDDISCI